MLLTLTTTHRPATDLGFLLHKHPGRVQSFDVGFGKAHVFYPEAGDERCTAAFLLDIDPVGLVRDRRAEVGFALAQYVNDRPYVASSFLSVALTRVLRTALSGVCEQRPELAQTPIPLAARLAVVSCRGGAALVRRLFEPLGYQVAAAPHALDPEHPDWGDSRYFTVELRATTRLADLLRHLYVLLPVLDDDKHYWVGDAEVEKLLRSGEGWLTGHPEREAIVERYLRHQRRLTRAALQRLLGEEEAGDPDAAAEARAEQEAAIERPLSLDERRRAAVVAALRAAGAARVVDMGCGEGRLLAELMAVRQFTEIVGVDVSVRCLDRAAERLHLERLPERQRARIQLLQGSATYRDARLADRDGIAAVEVIEHLEPDRLDAFAGALLGAARPATLVLTTPNAEYNVRFANLPAGRRRHADHRFEWTRAEFAAWCEANAGRHGYQVALSPIGDEDPALGAPTQMAVFTRCS